MHSGRAPRTPATLGDTGREVWRGVWAAGAGAFNPRTDRMVIQRYCELHDRRAELLAVIGQDGLMTTGSMGQAVMHPALRFVESTEKELRAIEAVLGLSLEARLRLGLAANELDKVTLADILGGGEDDEYDD
ncbi:phage terminase small subunit P27 family [Actinosynnema sp. NPDC020468]|uniref:phage terminase small subunit P27 family n=1 Tax=Actinosynnema sp. NPDC020468 TaxID=3154488 RepID=UPI0033DD1AC2